MTWRDRFKDLIVGIVIAIIILLVFGAVTNTQDGSPEEGTVILSPSGGGTVIISPKMGVITTTCAEVLGLHITQTAIGDNGMVVYAFRTSWQPAEIYSNEWVETETNVWMSFQPKLDNSGNDVRNDLLVWIYDPVCGDFTGDDYADISDLTRLVDFMFGGGGPLVCGDSM